MEGNPVCVQIPWDRNPEALAKWAEGLTGYPWIDAIMTQLRQEGWIHHLARHAVACFLTRGDLWISWEEGMKVRITKLQKTCHSVALTISLLWTLWCFYAGVWRVVAGCRLECKCWQLDVALLQFLFPAVFSLLLPCELRTTHRPQWWLHTVSHYFLFKKMFKDILEFERAVGVSHSLWNGENTILWCVFTLRPHKGEGIYRGFIRVKIMRSSLCLFVINATFIKMWSGSQRRILNILRWSNCWCDRRSQILLFTFIFFLFSFF